MLSFKRYQTIIILSITIVSLALAGCAIDSSALTYQNSVDVEFTINPSISINLSSNDLIIDNLTPGNSSDSNVITATVSTNAGYGYYMSATAGTSSTNTNLTSPTGSIFTNLSSNAATLSSFPDNYWGYSYSTDDGSTWISGSQGNANTGYDGLPLDNDDSGATGVILTSTDSFTNSGSVKFKIGAKASSTQASGTYTNTVNFYAVANPEPTLGPVDCDPGKICYHVNSLTQTEGTMGKQSASDGNTVTLLASNFSRTGYGFAGWSDTYDYTGNLYGPQETITTPTGTSTNGLSLYAIWVKSAGSMQSDATSICSGLTAASSTTKTLKSVSALTDERDGDTYAVAKLADGNCWMIENLRLESTNSDNSTGNLAQGYGGQFAGLADAETAWANNITTANSLYSTDGADSTINIGTSNAGYRFPRYNNLNTPSDPTNRPQNPTSNTFTNDSTTVGMYSYGNYYTWAAAIADTTAYSSGDHNTTSICPTGWKIPLGNTSTGDIEQGASDAANKVTGFSYLDRKMGGTGAYQSTAADSLRWRKFPVNFVYSGIVRGGSVLNRGSYGDFWSSTAFSSYSAYGLYLYSSSVYPGTNGNGKYSGRAVRCVAPGV